MGFCRRWRLAPALLLIITGLALSSEATPSRAEWLARVGADRWHAAGYRGQGVTVAVLDSGFRGWRSWLGRAIPSSVQTRSFRLDRQLEARDSCHGVLCGEVIHTLAPDAQLLFANWEPDRPDSFIQALAWARQCGARIATCSVIMPAWSDAEGGGPVHDAVAQVVGDGSRPGDLLCCACAGNTAQRHWTGRFLAGNDGYHQWQPGIVDNLVTPWSSDDRVSVELCWPGDAGFRLSVVDLASGREIGRQEPERGGHCAVVRFAPSRDAIYAARVTATTPSAGPFHLSVLGGWLGCSTERGSIPFPGDGAAFVAVGAWELGGQRAGYSSCGPNGKSPKPDFVATVPVPTVVRTRPFSGTSAAAPQAAGLAALLLSRNPSATAAEIRAALQAAAIDLAEPGHDPQSGFGLLRLPPP